MLNIESLSVSVERKTILEKISLEINPGEIHILMGPNGSGKSTLLKTLSGDPNYQIEAGRALFKGKDLLALKPEERSIDGLFMSFQTPIEIPGVSNLYFLQTAINLHRKARGESPVNIPTFIQETEEKMQLLNLDRSFLQRPFNDGFSGGEKKRNEILQMLLFEPDLVMLDEIDSGVDVDGMKLIASAINTMQSPHRSFLIVTHYEKLLTYLNPTHVHILHSGRIVASGDRALINKVYTTGFQGLQNG